MLFMDKMSTNVTITDIQGSLASDDMIKLIYMLYSNIPITKGIKIKIRGDMKNIDTFLDYVKNNPKYFAGIGCETPEFIIVDNNEDDVYVITEKDVRDQLDDIMINYI